MTIASIVLLAVSAVTFKGYVPPHAAADGLRFHVVADKATDLVSAMSACGIDDFAPTGGDGATTAYKFAVTRGTEANARCLRTRLPAGSRLTPLDHWTTNAQTD